MLKCDGEGWWQSKVMRENFLTEKQILTKIENKTILSDTS